MGDVLYPKPLQWARKGPPTDIVEDRVVIMAEKLMAALLEEVDPTTVQLAALRLVQKAIISNYQACMGTPSARELLKQSSELAGLYDVRGPNGETEA